jgi:hypothetical protein
LVWTGGGKLLAPGEVGVDLPFLKLEGRVVREGGVDPLDKGFPLGVGRLDQGVDVPTVSQVDPKPESTVFRL